MPDNLEESIRENAKAPAKASGDAGSVEQHKLSEQIAADRYLAGKQALPERGVVFVSTSSHHQAQIESVSGDVGFVSRYGVSV